MKLARFSIFLIGFAIIGLAISLMSNVDKSEAAFGTSPPWVRNDHLLPGTTYEQIINLSRNNPETDMQVKVRIDGDEIKRWLTIEDEKNLIMKKGQKILPMKVTVKVPRRAALKDYRGGIFVTLESIQDDEDKKGGTVAIKLGAHIVVELTVTGDKVVDYRVKSITLDHINEGDFFYLNTEVENMGNIELSELHGQADIYDNKETEILHSLTFGKLSDVIGPDTLFKSQIVFPDVKLDAGEYRVKVKVFKDDEVIYEHKLYQLVKESEVPVITPEDAEGRTKPSLPGSGDEEIAVSDSPAEADADDLRAVAPVIIQQEGSKFFLIFGIVGFVFGMFALVGIIVFLILLLKRQQQATLQQYLSQEHSQKMNQNLENKL